MTIDPAAIIFDFGGVLAHFYHPLLFQELETRLDLERGTLFEILWNSPDWRLAEIGAISDAEYWRRIGPCLGLKAQPAIRQLQAELFGAVQADPRLLDLIRRLRGRYQTGLLSNASDAVNPESLATRYGIVDLFDVIIVSARVGLAKPDPAIFRLALERLGCAAEATLFVDDHGPNVEAAAALGMRAIHFRDFETLLPALQQAGMSLPSRNPDPWVDVDR